MNLAQLFSHETNLKAFPAGQILFSQGEQGDLMYVFMSGTAEIIVHNKVVETAEAGAIVGEMAMFDVVPVRRQLLQRAIACFCRLSAGDSISLFGRHPISRYM